MRVVVVGAGIVGLAVARDLSGRGHTVTVAERAPAVATGQTGRNSGVVHAGLYYEPGSLRAQLCVRGREMLQEFCQRESLPYVECGKVVVAVSSSELAALDRIEQRARANLVPGLRRLDRSGLVEIEPHVRGFAALHSPRTAVTDFAAVARALASGLDVRLGAEVKGITFRRGEVLVDSGRGVLVADRVVLCAGHGSDRLARMAGGSPEPWIVPFRGEYWQLTPTRRPLVGGLVYPVPDPRYPFLGVHFTRRIDGVVDVGPNAVLHRVPLEAALPVCRMARRHWRAGVHEMSGSASKAVFVRRARRLVPDLRADDFVPAPAGVRAQALGRDGSLVDDFSVTGLGGRVVAVRNAPSPAATSAFAIAEWLGERVSHRAT